jgi:hypothetical protein
VSSILGAKQVLFWRRKAAQRLYRENDGAAPINDGAKPKKKVGQGKIIVGLGLGLGE